MSATSFPCADLIDCPCDDSPFENLSAEGVDSRTVPSFFYGCAEPDGIPAVCEADTQELAELCAARSCDNYDVFYSRETSCACSTDASITYTAASGSFIGLTQEDADALAESFACNVAELMCDGGPTPEIFSSTAQTCEATCDGGTVSYTAMAGSFLGLTQVGADFFALQFACDVAALLCSEGGGPDNPNPTPTPRFSAFNGRQSCTIDCADGGEFTYFVAANTFRANNAAQANAMAYSYACNRAMAARFCLGDHIPDRLCIDSGGIFVISITGNSPDSGAFSLTGTIPTGMAFSNGVLSGTPTATGTFTFTVTLLATDGNYATREYTMVIVAITNTSPIDEAVINMSYVYNFFTSSGDQEAQQWVVLAGNLPAGVTLTEAGVLQGTPTESGSFPITVRVLDSTAGYEPLSCMKDFAFTVGASNPCDDPLPVTSIHSSSAAAIYNSVSEDAPANSELEFVSAGLWQTPLPSLFPKIKVQTFGPVYRCFLQPTVGGVMRFVSYQRSGGDLLCPFGEYTLLSSGGIFGLPGVLSVTL